MYPKTRIVIGIIFCGALIYLMASTKLACLQAIVILTHH